MHAAMGTADAGTGGADPGGADPGDEVVMCGIAGIIAPAAAVHRQSLERMVASLRHRGPDGEGVHVFAGCALGHTRLSIVDPEGGRQPMLTPDGGLGITFNGEIYGYREIRRQLSGYRFRTASDTELILALYRQHGAEMASRLPGMFAFALWDDRERTLVAARDRFGEKPFYYARGSDGEWIFASELKAILASGLVAPVISRRALVHYLRHGYVHPGATIYANVHVLPPAHRLIWRDGRVEVRRYWRLPPPRSEPIGMAAAATRLGHLLRQAVGRQLVADVPVGALLSGGLDSSTVVAAAAEAATGLRTFCFDFGDPRRDERPFARAVAESCGTEHSETTLDDADAADAADLGTLLHEMTRVYDEPFGDSSNVPTYLICREVRRHRKVVLTGDGGDELLAGYDFWYRPLRSMEQAPRASPWPVVGLRLLAAVRRRLGLPAWPGAALRRRHGTLARAHRALQTNLDDAALRRLGLPPADAADAAVYDTLDEALRHDLGTYLPGDILTKVDRASMAHGLELRAPFLDVELASFCVSLPCRLKIDAAADKLVLRQAFADRWPAAIRDRGKQGFGAPVDRWLQAPAVRALVEEYLGARTSRIYDLISYSAARSLARTSPQRAWILLVLALWAESHPFPVGE
jgi:asparagine synthase (glutamine-hydrolysing)